MRCRRAFAGLLVAGVAGVAACGGGGAEDLGLSSTTSTTSTVAMAQTTAVETTAVETTTAPASTTEVTPPAPWVEATSNLAGLPSECGTVSVVAAHPIQGNVIAGIALHGLWSLAVGATEWTPLGVGGGDSVVGRPNDLTFDPDDSARFWTATIYGEAGVFRTDDGGATFHRLGNVAHVDAVSVDFTDPERQTLIAGQHESSVVQRSTDGGETWTEVPRPLGDVGQAFAVLVVDRQTYLVGTKGSPSSAVFRTTDGGASWTPVHDGGVSSQPLVSPDGTIRWVLESGGLIVSTDGGATWTVVPSDIAGSPSLVQLPDGRLAGLRGSHVAVSADSGSSWTATGSQLPYSPQGLTYSPAHKAFFIWRIDCGGGDPVPVGADNIMSAAFDGG